MFNRLRIQSRRGSSFAILVTTAVCLSAPVFAQNAPRGGAETAVIPDAPEASVHTVRGKWNHFLHETVGLLSFGGSLFNAGFAQATQTDPKYGTGGKAYAERFGASWADIATQNFFGDFVIASAFHEDPIYYRAGREHSFLYRFGYAVSRTVVIRKDNGGNTFNFDSIGGSAASSAISNAYYPPASRGGKATLMHFGIDVADNGFVNLAPEFWPDFRNFITRHHRRGASH